MFEIIPFTTWFFVVVVVGMKMRSAYHTIKKYSCNFIVDGFQNFNLLIQNKMQNKRSANKYNTSKIQIYLLLFRFEMWFTFLRAKTPRSIEFCEKYFNLQYQISYFVFTQIELTQKNELFFVYRSL